MSAPPAVGRASAQPELRHRIWRAAGGLSLVFIPNLVLCVAYVGFCYVLPARQQLIGHLTDVAWLAHTLPGCWLAVCFGFNWISCVCADPGCASGALYRRLVTESIAAGVLPRRAATCLQDHHCAVAERWQLSQLQECGRRAGVGEQFLWDVCHKSGMLKPPLAHYCRVRGTLVLNYDHYCPWVANTIGLGNYRHFLLTVFHFTVGCVYCVVEVAPVVYVGFRDHRHRTGAWREWNFDTTGSVDVTSSSAAPPFSTFGLYGLLSFVSAALLGALLVGSFGVWHLLNLASPGTTTNVARVRELPAAALVSGRPCQGDDTCPQQRHCREWWQRECGCGAPGGEFAVAYENGVEAVRTTTRASVLLLLNHYHLVPCVDDVLQGLSYRGWLHNWARLMGGENSYGRGGVHTGPGGVRICMWCQELIGVAIALFVPRWRSAPWPPYCCEHLTSREKHKNA